MLLTCDIGNTNIKSGLFSDENLLDFRIFPSTKEFIQYAESSGVNDLAISSVVPATFEEIKNTLAGKFKLKLIDRYSDFNLKINYESIESLGIDRLCACEGAFYLYRKSGEFQNYNEKTFLAVIDFGTATTINLVKYPGEFSGGIISPGLQLMISSLNSKTAQLPVITPGDYKAIIGKSTKQSIASGVINMNTGLIEKVKRNLQTENNAEQIKIFITGGNAEAILPYFEFEYVFEKALVLYGIQSAYNKSIKHIGT